MQTIILRNVSLCLNQRTSETRIHIGISEHQMFLNWCLLKAELNTEHTVFVYLFFLNNF